MSNTPNETPSPPSTPSSRLPTLRNPGLYSFLIFLAACAMVIALYELGAPDALKLGGELVMLVITGFGAKSALASSPKPAVSVARDKPQTWPGVRVSQDMQDESPGADKSPPSGVTETTKTKDGVS